MWMLALALLKDVLFFLRSTCFVNLFKNDDLGGDKSLLGSTKS
jgi:hypothetical protein